MDPQDRPVFPREDSLVEAWVRHADDWSGVTNRQQRKRIQNRRNQRTYRAKKRAACNNEPGRSIQDANLHSKPFIPIALVYHHLGLELSHGTNEAEAIEDIIQAVSSVNILTPGSESNQRAMQRFEEYAIRSYVGQSRTITILPSLSQFNFIRSLLINVDVLGLSAADMHDDALSPFNAFVGPPRTSLQQERLYQLPAGLQPTDLQRETPHHPWIDLLPVPAMRDNIFRRGFDFFDEDQLCHDMRGVIPGQNPGVLVWGDPWDPDAWEVTEEFVKSWGWVVADCWDLLRSTNRWRKLRSMKPLSLNHLVL